MTQSKTDPSLPVKELAFKQASLFKLFIKTSLITLGFLAILIFITATIFLSYAWQQWQVFSHTSGASLAEVKQIITTGWQQPVMATNGYKNILILGVDALANRGESPALTDTMMIVSLNLATGKIKTLPLPRDIWHPEYQTKINALLVYGSDQSPDNPADFPTAVLAEMTGVQFHHTVVISLDTLGALIDAVGGIEVNVDQAFTDPTFPRTDVDVTTETDPEKLYQTVSFVAGPQMMSGERALTFIRSRHSQDDQGTDLARSQRQQKVITSLVEKISSTETLTDAETMATLYRFYQDSFADDIPPTEVVATLKQMLPVRSMIEFESVSLPIIEAGSTGAITHPPVSPNQYQGQWVYIIPDLTTFQTYTHQLLF